MSNENWWVTPSGVNLLSGLDTYNTETNTWDNDADDPAKLHRWDIIDFLRRLPAARESFNHLYAKMSVKERVRLDEIATAAEFREPTHKDKEDTFQSKMNTVGIYTTGPRGGGN